MKLILSNASAVELVQVFAQLKHQLKNRIQ